MAVCLDAPQRRGDIAVAVGVHNPPSGQSDAARPRA